VYLLEFQIVVFLEYCKAVYRVHEISKITSDYYAKKISSSSYGEVKVTHIKHFASLIVLGAVFLLLSNSTNRMHLISSMTYSKCI
jgi:hypothetical protein